MVNIAMLMDDYDDLKNEKNHGSVSRREILQICTPQRLFLALITSQITNGMLIATYRQAY